MIEKPRFAIISEVDHPIQLQAFMDSRFSWYSINRLKDNLEKMEGGLLLLENLPEIIYKNASKLAKLAYHWITINEKYTSTRLTEIAQKAGVTLHFINYPFQTKYWSCEFLQETIRAFEIQS